MTVMELDKNKFVENQRAFEEQVKSENAQDHIICDDFVDEVHEAIEKGEVKATIPEKLEKRKSRLMRAR